MIDYLDTVDAVAPTPRLLSKYVEAHAKRGRRYLTRLAKRHAKQVDAALESIRVGLGDDDYTVTVTPIGGGATVIRVTTDKFGRERTVSSTKLFRIVRDNPEVTGLGWLGRLHGSCIVVHTDRGKQEWGKS